MYDVVNSPIRPKIHCHQVSEDHEEHMSVDSMFNSNSSDDEDDDLVRLLKSFFLDVGLMYLGRSA